MDVIVFFEGPVEWHKDDDLVQAWQKGRAGGKVRQAR